MADDNFTAAIEMGDAGAVRWLINWMVQMLRISFSKAVAYCQICSAILNFEIIHLKLKLNLHEEKTVKQNCS